MNTEADVMAREYLKNEGLRKDDVQNIKIWAKKQGHLPEMTDLQVTLFLHRCLYNSELAKKRLDSYFTQRTTLSQIYLERDPKKLQKAWEVKKIAILPKPTPEGYRIFYMKISDPDVEKFNLEESYKLHDMCLTLDWHKNGTCPGYVLVYDLEHASIRHLFDPDLNRLRRVTAFFQTTLPIRIKGIHMIHAKPYLVRGFAFLKQFLTPKMKERFNVHENLDTFYKYLPKECLPDDIGGSVGKLQEIFDNAQKTQLANADIFAEEDRQSVDESKRPEQSKDFGTNFGVEGTFKKLNID